MKPVTYVISVPLETADATTALKLRAAIDDMCAADPTLGVTIGPANEIILQGQHELQLGIAVDILKRGKGPDFMIGAPQVAYRETITKTVEWDYTHMRQTGGSGQYAKVKIRFEPGAPGSGFVFENDVVGGAVPKEFIPGVEKGLTNAKETGVVAGFPVIDLKCTLIDGGYHDVDSNVMTFDIAARACFREAIPKAGPRLLEPMMKVEVVTPQEYIGDVIGDLNSRRGQVQGMDSRGNAQVISAMVPLGNMFGYPSTLRSMTQGRAECTMAFDHYEQVPPNPPGGGDDFPMAAALRW
jgi:elongation factor G